MLAGVGLLCWQYGVQKGDKKILCADKIPGVMANAEGHGCLLVFPSQEPASRQESLLLESAVLDWVAVPGLAAERFV